MPNRCTRADVSQLGKNSVTQERCPEKQHKSESHQHIGNIQSPGRECQERVESWPGEEHSPKESM